MPSRKIAKTVGRIRGLKRSMSTRPREVLEIIQQAFDDYRKRNLGQNPTIYRLSILSGQSKYFCKKFLEQDFRNPQQANANRSQNSISKLKKAYDAYLKKHKVTPSIRVLAAHANASHRSAQAYLKTLPAELPTAQLMNSSLMRNSEVLAKKDRLPANSSKFLKPFLPFGKLTKARQVKLDEAYEWFKKKKGKEILSRKDVGRITGRAGVDFWIGQHYFTQMGVLDE